MIKLLQFIVIKTINCPPESNQEDQKPLIFITTLYEKFSDKIH